MGCRILQALPLVCGDRQNFVSAGDDGSYGYLSPFGGLFGGEEGAAHHGEVAFVVGLKFRGHGADNSKDG